MATKQKQYTLYIDESQTHDNFEKQPHFCMAGAIINDREYGIVENEINKLKRTIWSDYSHPEKIILHQKNIIDASKGNLSVKSIMKEYAQNFTRSNHIYKCIHFLYVTWIRPKA